MQAMTKLVDRHAAAATAWSWRDHWYDEAQASMPIKMGQLPEVPRGMIA